MARVLKHLPTAVSLWSPEDVATFLRSKGHMEAAQRVEKSVRLHSFDEVDGPRVLRYGMKGLQGGLDVFLGNIFYVHPYLGKGLKPPTRFYLCFFHCFIHLLFQDRFKK